MDTKYLATATLIGTIIGAGFLGIPAAFSSIGFLPGLIMLTLVAILTISINLYVGELVSEVEEVHQMTGFARMFLGKTGEILMFISVLAGITGAIIAYTVATGSILENITGINSGITIVLLTIIMSYFIWRGVEQVSKLELILVSIMVVFLIALSIYTMPSIQQENIAKTDWKNIATPYGVLLFSLLGYSAVPEAEKIVKENKKKLKQSIIFSITVSAILYTIFAFSFVGVFGNNVKDVATESLSGIIGLVGNLLAVLTMATSYLVLGLVMKDTYVEDLKIGKNRAVLFTILPAFLISFLVKPGFLNVIGLTGALSGGLTGILVCLMILKMKKQKFNLIIYLLIAIFTLGIIQSV